MEPYSITTSARSSKDSGIARPIAFAVLRLMIGSYLDAGSTGRSAGFAPRAACMASLHRHCPRHVRRWTMDCYVPLPWPDSYRYHHCEKTSNTPICLIGKRCGYARTFLPGDAASSPSVATVSPTPRPFECRRKAIGSLIGHAYFGERRAHQARLKDSCARFYPFPSSLALPGRAVPVPGCPPLTGTVLTCPRRDGRRANCSRWWERPVDAKET